MAALVCYKTFFYQEMEPKKIRLLNCVNLRTKQMAIDYDHAIYYERYLHVMHYFVYNARWE